MGLVSELRRRNVIRVAIAYAVAAWLLIEITATTFPILKLPDWSVTLVTVLVLIGFPLALIFAWAFELTPEGLKKEKDVNRSQSITHVTGKKFDYVIIAALVLALGYFAFDKFVLDASREAELVRTTTEAVTEQATESGKAEAADKSIAVLPFRNRSALAEDAYFVDGIHDDILTQLAKLSSFGKVISRTSMEQYRETTKPMPQIGQELGVAIILEGSVQRAGDRVRVNVQLIEAASDEHLWAETYDRRLTVENIFLVQEQIAREVAKALRVTLTPQEDKRLAKLPTTSLNAYRLYNLGRQETYKRTADSTERAIEYFEDAIRSDPDYAQAYAGLARVYLYQHMYGGLSRKDALRQARPAAARSIQLDPILAEGYAALGLVNQWERQWAAAESNFDTAIAVNPGSTWARLIYGVFLSFDPNRYDEAIIQFEAATRLSPLDASAHSQLAYTYAQAHRSQDALETLHYALNLDPDHPPIYEFFGDVYGLFLGRLDEAVKWYARGLQRDPSSVRLRPFITAFYLDLGDIPTARLLIEQQINSAMHAQVPAETLRLALLLYLRRYEEALKFAEEDWQRRGQLVDGLLQDLYSLSGQYQRALEINDQRIELYEDVIPHPETKVTARNLTAAIYRAAILAGMGENARAQQLLNNCLAVAKTVPSRRNYLMTNFQLVQIYALLGDVPNAMLALRESIDAGRRSGWWIDLLHSPITAPLRNEPQFEEMVEEIRADMAAQLANVWEMQRTGEMPPLPVINP